MMMCVYKSRDNNIARAVNDFALFGSVLFRVNVSRDFFNFILPDKYVKTLKMSIRLRC